MKSHLYICGAEISTSIEAVGCVVRACVVKKKEKRKKKCTQHVLNGPLSVCTPVQLCCAHVLVCQRLSCVANFGSATQARSHFTPHRNGSLHFFSVVKFDFFLFLFCFALRHNRTSVSCVCPQRRNQFPLQSRSVCRWDPSVGGGGGGGGAQP